MLLACARWLPLKALAHGTTLRHRLAFPRGKVVLPVMESIPSVSTETDESSFSAWTQMVRPFVLGPESVTVRSEGPVPV